MGSNKSSEVHPGAVALKSNPLHQLVLYVQINVAKPKNPSASDCTDDSPLISAARLAGVHVSAEEIAVSSTAQIHKLEVILEELDKRLGQEDGGGLKWSVKRESRGRLNQGSNSWRALNMMLNQLEIFGLML